MIPIPILILLSCVIQLCLGKQEYDFVLHRLTDDNWIPGHYLTPPRMDVYDRMLLLARQIYEDANLRVLEMDDYRFMYEETPEYESGYIMGEIMERYRKMMEEGRMSYANLNRKYDPLRHGGPGLLARLEKAQMYYFEIYHLVRMLHEVVPKYKRSTKNLGARKPGSKLDPGLLGIDPDIKLEDIIAETEKQKLAREKKEAAERREKARKERMENQRQSIADRIAEREKLKEQRKYSYYEKTKVNEYTRWPTGGNGRYLQFPFDYGWDIAGWW